MCANATYDRKHMVGFLVGHFQKDQEVTYSQKLYPKCSTACNGSEGLRVPRWAQSFVFLSGGCVLSYLLLRPVLRVHAERHDPGYIPALPTSCCHWDRWYPAQLEQDRTFPFGYGPLEDSEAQGIERTQPYSFEVAVTIQKSKAPGALQRSDCAGLNDLSQGHNPSLQQLLLTLRLHHRLGQHKSDAELQLSQGALPPYGLALGPEA